MFSKFIHRFSGKNKRAAALFTAAILLCGLAGCDSSETGNSILDNSGEISQSISSDESKNPNSSE